MAARPTGAAPDEPVVSVPSARGGAAPAQDAVWHVNIGNGEPRTMTLVELVASYNAGQVTQDMLVWSEGMDQWQPLAEAPAVVSALRGDASAETAAQVTETAADSVSGAEMMPGEPMFDRVSSDEARRGAARPVQGAVQPEVSDDATRIAVRPGPVAVQAATPAVEAKRAAVGKRETRGRDLFSTYAGEELQASAQTAANMVEASRDDGRLTGQRNENSLLFSLAVLTKSADERAPSPEAPTKEDSGIIDLKALVARSESMRPAMRAAAVDMFTSPLGLVPPTLADLGARDVPGPAKSKAPLLVAAIAGVAVLLLLGIVIGVRLAGAGSAAAPAASAVGPVEAPSATASAEPSATAAPMPSDSAPPAASAAPKKAAHPGGGNAKPAVGGNAPVHAAPNALPPSPAPKKGNDCGCNGDLMCMMKCSTH